MLPSLARSTFSVSSTIGLGFSLLRHGLPRSCNLGDGLCENSPTVPSWVSGPFAPLQAQLRFGDFGWFDSHEAPAGAAVDKFDDATYLREEGIVLAAADVGAR